MKKLLLLFIFIIFICGCSNNSAPKPQIENLQFCAAATYNKQNYFFTVKSGTSSALFISVSKPDTINGLTIYLTPDNTELEFLKLKKELPYDNIEKESPIKILYEGYLKAFSLNTLGFRNDSYFLDYSLGKNQFRFFFTQGGLPLSIKGINNDTEIIISKVKILN